MTFSLYPANQPIDRSVAMAVLEIDNVTKTPVADARPPEEAVATDEARAPATREVRHEYTRALPALLDQLGVSLLVSTYQAGKVVAVGVAEGELTLSHHNFERAMGLAVGPDRIAVGARAQVWFLNSAPHLARRVAPVGRHDACFLTRSSHFTGEIHAHDLAWAVGQVSNLPVRPRGSVDKGRLETCPTQPATAPPSENGHTRAAD